MTMKRTELEKRQALAIVNAQRRAGNDFGPSRAPHADRKARRDLDRAAGLVAFPLKLPADLAAELRQRALREQRRLDDLVAELLSAAVEVNK